MAPDIEKVYIKICKQLLCVSRAKKPFFVEAEYRLLPQPN
jgi:hypothetical protein